MLKKINAGLFEEGVREIELAVKAQGNPGTESAQFDYDSNVLAQDTVGGHPGCRFTVKAGTRQFKAMVAFGQGAGPAARYDLFQVNASGSLTAVGKGVSNTGGTPLIGFGIAGVPVTVPAGAGGRRKRAKPPKRAGRKTKTAISRKTAASSRKAKSAATPKRAGTKRASRAKRARSPKRAKSNSIKKR